VSIQHKWIAGLDVKHRKYVILNSFSSMDKELLVLWVIKESVWNPLQMLARIATSGSIDMSVTGLGNSIQLIYIYMYIKDTISYIYYIWFNQHVWVAYTGSVRCCQTTSLPPPSWVHPSIPTSGVKVSRPLPMPEDYNDSFGITVYSGSNYITMLKEERAWRWQKGIQKRKLKKEKQYNGQRKRTNNDLQNTTQKTNDRATLKVTIITNNHFNLINKYLSPSGIGNLSPKMFDGWWMLSQGHVVCTNLEIYVFICYPDYVLWFSYAILIRSYGFLAHKEF
jgi:hypothetical protein